MQKNSIKRFFTLSLGTKTLLFGVHQVFIHPFMVTVSWIILYKSLPSWRELVCIFIHDWGYWGKADLKGRQGDMHPLLGARIAKTLFGPKFEMFILGHSTFFCKRMAIPCSKLMAPDKYWHCIIPYWFYWILAAPTGELRHYRDLNHARQVANPDVSDAEWFNALQIVCQDKANGTYKIDEKELSK